MSSLTQEAYIAEQATGCLGAGDYREWAREQGYGYLEVYDWTSSAGDWTFIVSKDGERWHVMSQNNNWPNRGFTHSIDTDQTWHGTADEVLEAVYEFYSL